MLYKSKSNIEGNGLFSSKLIKKGDIIGTFRVRPAIYVTKFSMWVEGEHLKVTNIVKYANHSSTPNSYIDYPLMIAIRNIAPDQEITWMYGGW